MSTETYRPSTTSYEERQKAGEQLLLSIGDGARGLSYFNTVIRPNLLPEDVPIDLPEKVRWIGEKGARSIWDSTEALGELLIRLVEIDAMQIESASICAEALDVHCFYDTQFYELPAKQTRKHAQCRKASSAGTLATITPLPERIIPDSFGEPAKILSLPPSGAQPGATQDYATPADIIELRPEIPGATILEFQQYEA